jgi:predicted nucleic acid-binding protein
MVIDTCIFIEHLRARDKTRTTLYLLPSHKNLYVSAVSIYELYMGANTAEKKNDIKVLTADLPTLAFDGSVAVAAAKIYHQLKSSNKMIEFRDIFIAATCLVNDLPLITLNQKHFLRIEGLQLV